MKNTLPSFLVIWLILNLCPVQAQTGTVIASGFMGISGIEADAEGHLWVCEVGTGNNDSQVSVVDPDGNVQVFLTGLPSESDTISNETAGAWRTYHLSNDKVAIVIGEGTGPLFGHILSVDKAEWSPGTPLTLADVDTLVDVSSYVLAQGYAESNPYSMAQDATGRLVVVDAAANAMFRYDPTADTIGLLANFPSFPNPTPVGPPFVDAVPTKVVAKAGGGFYVCQLTGFPFATGSAKVFEVSDAGTITTFADDLTMLTDMHYDPTDGALTVLQFAAFANGFLPNSAQIIKLQQDGSRDTLVRDFGPSPSFTFDASGDIYATHLFFNQVIKFDAITAVAEEHSPSFSKVAIFPNPSTGYIQLQYDLAENVPVWMELYDPLGRLIELREIALPAPGRQSVDWQVNQHALQQGYYQVRLRSPRTQLTERILVLPR